MPAPKDRELTSEEVAILEKGHIQPEISSKVVEHRSASKLGLSMQYLAVYIWVVTLGAYAYSVFY